MAESDTDPLLVATLATLHTVLLVVVGVLGLLATGAAGDLLGGLDTLVGVLLFGALWGVVALTHRRLFGRVDLAGTSLVGLLRPAVVHGALTGWLFFLVLFLLVATAFATSGGFASLGDLLTSLSIVLGAGSVLSLLVGAAVGVVGAVVDRALVRAVGLALPA
jgi:hypothetical protein